MRCRSSRLSVMSMQKRGTQAKWQRFMAQFQDGGRLETAFCRKRGSVMSVEKAPWRLTVLLDGCIICHEARCW